MIVQRNTPLCVLNDSNLNQNSPTIHLQQLQVQDEVLLAHQANFDSNQGSSMTYSPKNVWLKKTITDEEQKRKYENQVENMTNLINMTLWIECRICFLNDYCMRDMHLVQRQRPGRVQIRWDEFHFSDLLFSILTKVGPFKGNQIIKFDDVETF